jgi:hypothetical protein
VTFGVGWNHRVYRVLSFLSSRRNWNSPTPSPTDECVPPPLVWGTGYTLFGLRQRGVGESQFRRGDIDCGTLGIYCIYVLCGCNLYSIDLQAPGPKMICCFLCLEHAAKRRKNRSCRPFVFKYLPRKACCTKGLGARGVPPPTSHPPYFPVKMKIYFFLHLYQIYAIFLVSAL